MKKKILAHIAILLILTGGFCNVYIKGLSVSCGGNQLSAFAADDTNSWESVSKDDLVTAFKYYCKSRNLAIEGSVPDAVTSFTTSTFNNLCNTLGIDSDSLQSELKKTTEGNLGLRFLFTQSGISAYNRIFAEFLQNNDLGVGDSVDDLTLYDGKYGTDENGNGSLIWVLSNVGGSYDSLSDFVVSRGSFYLYDLNYDYKTLYESGDPFLYYPFGSVQLYRQTTSLSNGIRVIYVRGSSYAMFYSYDSSFYVKGGTILFVKQDNPTTMYLGSFTMYRHSDQNLKYTAVNLRTLSNNTITTQDVTINANTYNNTINNNTYNNNYTIIYNDGDYYDYDDDDEPDPSTPPGGGGGGGGDDPDQPPIVDPTPTPEPSIPDWDIELPEMPVGNEWLLYGLEKKFPWDIPFNLMYMLSLFAADPETPHFQGTLDLKVVQWDYDIDLAPFDDIARNVRNFEFVGFIIGLMLLTRKLIWG